MNQFDFSANLILENRRVKLIPLKLAHVVDLLEVATTDKNLLKLSPSLIHSKELLTKYIADALQDLANLKKYPFAIFDKQTNQYAGSTSFGAISNKDRRLEIGWTWIGKDFQRTGLNRNCKFLLLRYAFEELGFERVELKTDARNTQSRTAMEKIGAQFEGQLRSHTVMSDGYRRDTVYYSILKNEWPTIKQTVFKGY